MKKLALVAALAVLPACTVFHPERRQLLSYNWDALSRTVSGKPESPKDKNDWDRTATPVINWVFVAPFQALMLPFSFLGDALVVNPINGFEKAEIQTYNRRFSNDDIFGSTHSGVANYQLAPLLLPPLLTDLIAVPEFLARWIWNSTYWTDPVDQDSWNRYWNDHHESSTQ
jgi:hypothetical protein